jgi:hypothetical protein
MAIVHRVVRLSQLAFFLSLGAAAALISACSNDAEPDGKDPSPGTGGTATKDTVGAGGSATSQAGASTKTPGITLPNMPLGGRAATERDASNAHAGEGGLWDVICE